MSSSHKLLAIAAALGFLNAGCNSPDNLEVVSQTTNIATSLKTSDPNQEQTPPEGKPSSESKVLAELSSFESTTAEHTSPSSKGERKPVSVVPAHIKPATAKEAIAIVNLLELPRMKEKAVLQSGPTNLYYSCKGMLPEADDFYKKMFEVRGWKELSPLTQPTDQYIDRLFEKDGYCVRASLSLGSERGEVGVTLASLGNVDMRSLPRLSDAEELDPGTQVTLTYRTANSIPDAVDAIHKQLTQEGWQRCQEFYATPVDVPHYRDVHYRKEACRLLVGIAKNPQNPADKTSVSYLAEYVTPFDIPTLDGSRALKLDLFKNRASFEMTNSRKDLVSCLQSDSQKFGWKVSDADKFVSGESHMLPIHVESGAYLVARLVESGGVYSGSIECFAKAPKSEVPAVESVAGTDAKPASGKSAVAKDSAFEELNAQVNSAIQSELTKALGSLGTSSKDPPANLAELQSKAAALQATLGTSDETRKEDQNESERLTENPFDSVKDE